MWEINGYIISYNTKTHKWLIRKNGEIVNELGFNETIKWCKEN